MPFANPHIAMINIIVAIERLIFLIERSLNRDLILLTNQVMSVHHPTAPIIIAPNPKKYNHQISSASKRKFVLAKSARKKKTIVGLLIVNPKPVKKYLSIPVTRI